MLPDSMAWAQVDLEKPENPDPVNHHYPLKPKLIQSCKKPTPANPLKNHVEITYPLRNRPSIH